MSLFSAASLSIYLLYWNVVIVLKMLEEMIVCNLVNQPKLETNLSLVLMI